MSDVIEVCVSGENTKETYAYKTQPDSLYKQLTKVFPWVRKENYLSISTPTYHEILQEDVITCCIPKLLSTVFFGESVVLSARKFCMSSAKSYIRAYYKYEGDTPSWLPSGCTLMFYTDNVEEYGRPFPSAATTFSDFYFSGDPATVEEHFSLPEKRGDHTTLYGVTREGDTTRRVKQYCYDESNVGSGWVALYNFLNEGS